MTELEALKSENQTLKDLLKNNRAERTVLDQLAIQHIRENVALKTYHQISVDKIEELTEKIKTLEKDLARYADSNAVIDMPHQTETSNIASHSGCIA